jgi:hypothetical protein
MGVISDSGRDALSNLRALKLSARYIYSNVDMKEIPVYHHFLFQYVLFIMYNI